MAGLMLILICHSCSLLVYKPVITMLRILRPPKYILVVLSFLILILFLYFTVVPKKFFGDLFLDNSETYNIVLAEWFYEQSLRYEFSTDNKPREYVLYQLGRIEFIKGNFEQSEKYLLKELELFPEHAHTYYTLGLVYGYESREEEAIDAFRKFLEYMPSSLAARNDLAWLLFRVGDLEAAMEVIEPAVLLAEPNPWILNTYGVIVMNLGDLDTAENSLVQAQRLVEVMTPADWGKAYPGNHPAIYDEGLEAMRTSINNNLQLIKQKLQDKEGILLK
jgi:Flp pilus assembly protein TadD